MLAPFALASQLFSYTAATIGPSGTTGAAVVVADDRGVVACRGFGVDGDGRPMTCDTPVVLASLTKAVTAVAVMQLVRRHAIALDDPVQRYVPWFSARDSQASRKITVRDLLNQRSGFSESTGRAWLASSDGGDDILARRVLALQSANLVEEPGTSFEYSNVNYDVLGVLIATVARMPYRSYVTTHVLQPLGLFDARFSCTPADPHGYVRVFSVPVRAGRQPQFCADSPAGGLVMTAAQYGHFLAANIDGGRTWSARILDRAGWETLHRSPPDQPYAMGWYESIYGDGTRELRHAGEAPGFRSFVVMLPVENVGAARLADVDEVPDGGRDDLVDRGLSATLEGRLAPAIPPIPQDLYLRTFLLAVALALVFAILRAVRDPRPRFVGAAVSAVSALALLWFIVPQWGGSPAVGFLFSPDLTVLVISVVALLVAHVAVSLRRARR